MGHRPPRSVNIWARCLAHDCFARFIEQAGRQERFVGQLLECIQAYVEWGAAVRVRQLARQYAPVLDARLEKKTALFNYMRDMRAERGAPQQQQLQLSTHHQSRRLVEQTAEASASRQREAGGGGGGE